MPRTPSSPSPDELTAPEPCRPLPGYITRDFARLAGRIADLESERDEARAEAERWRAAFDRLVMELVELQQEL